MSDEIRYNTARSFIFGMFPCPAPKPELSEAEREKIRELFKVSDDAARS